MKALLHVIAFFGLFAVSALHAPAFEGKVSLGFTDGKNREQIVDYAMKGALVRMELKQKDDGSAAMIMDAAKGEMTIIMPEQHMYMIMSMRSAAAQGKADSAAQESKIEKTGRTETILGYLCEEYVTTDRGQTTAMWLTDKLGSFMGLSGGNPMSGMMGGRGAKASKPAGWESLLKDKGGVFPLRVVVTDKSGKDSFRLEAKKIEPGALPDDLFVPPAGFQKFSMPALSGFGG